MSAQASQRPSCLDTVPEWLESFLGTCPRSPNGVHQWMAKAAWRMHDYLSSEEQVKTLYWALRDCGRALQPREVEHTITNISKKRNGQSGVSSTRPWPEPVLSEVDKIICRGPWNLTERTPGDINPALSAHDWLRRLFPPGTLLCVSQEVVYLSSSNLEPFIFRRWHTRRIETWAGRYAAICDSSSLLVPNPAAFTWHYTMDHRRSTRCNGMFPQRLYLVSEFDFSEKSSDGKEDTIWAPLIRKWRDRGISIRGACAALLWHLAQYAPLVLAVWSGGKSLHGWFNFAGTSEETQRLFMEYAVAIGACYSTWTRCQLVRLPAGLRPNGNRQTVEYFDSSNLPGAL
jgi:hypothetical protein